MTRPFLKRTSGSNNGGWPLFCRLLLWATRNNHACARLPEPVPEAEPVRRRQPRQRVAEVIPVCPLAETSTPSKA